MKIPKIYNIFKGQIAKIFFGSEIIHENMQKYTSTLERHTKFMKFGLETRLRSKVLKAIGNLKVFFRIKIQSVVFK